ncbi:hypothetical protein LP417_31160 [Polaromonas sp. P1-6]|nr:hypothetical protein LP417_31160 [Polaromonas sp. P1-6]
MRIAHDEAEAALAASRTRLEQLQSDPAMQDANRLEQADRDAKARQNEAERAQRTRDEAQTKFKREVEATRERSQRAAQAEQALAEARGIAQDCAERSGITDVYASNPLAALDAAALTALQPLAFDTARNDLRHVVATRREQIALMQRRCRSRRSGRTSPLASTASPRRAPG